jgi:hypothetical protein
MTEAPHGKLWRCFGLGQCPGIKQKERTYGGFPFDGTATQRHLDLS